MNQVTITIPNANVQQTMSLSSMDNWNSNICKQEYRQGNVIANAFIIGVILAAGVTETQISRHYDPSVSKLCACLIETPVIKSLSNRKYSINLKVVSIKKGRPSICNDIEA
jgi:hypothetical protein